MGFCLRVFAGAGFRREDNGRGRGFVFARGGMGWGGSSVCARTRDGEGSPPAFAGAGFRREDTGGGGFGFAGGRDGWRVRGDNGMGALVFARITGWGGFVFVGGGY